MLIKRDVMLLVMVLAGLALAYPIIGYSQDSAAPDPTAAGEPKSDQNAEDLKQKEAQEALKEAEEQRKKEEAERIQEAKAAQKAAGAESVAPAKRLPVSAGVTIGRNDLVTITDGTQTQELKYKKAELLLNKGWTLVEK